MNIRTHFTGSAFLYERALMSIILIMHLHITLLTAKNWTGCCFCSFVVVHFSVNNGVAKTLKKLRTSKGDYCIKK